MTAALVVAMLLGLCYLTFCRYSLLGFSDEMDRDNAARAEREQRLRLYK